MPDIFQKRTVFKPYEYPEAIGFVDAINHSYWLVSEWNFIKDIQDFKSNLSDKERNTVKRAMLAISQIEVAVKTFWMKIAERFPKPEFWAVAACFGESEQRHESAYSKLLETLGFNDDFSTILENPVIKGRVDYLQKYIKNSAELKDKEFTLSLALFSLFIENVSLFSQFALIKSFNKHKNVLKDIDNVVSATMQEENCHFLFGSWLINKIKEENPKWFNEEFYEEIYKACKKSYTAEAKIIDWMFEDGDLDFIDAITLKEFIKNRFNESVKSIGGEKVFETDEEKLNGIYWVTEELHAISNTDFFHKRPVSYSKNMQAVTENDLF